MLTISSSPSMRGLLLPYHHAVTYSHRMVTPDAGSRPRDSASTQERILSAVGRLLASSGFADLGVNAVAREAGIGMGPRCAAAAPARLHDLSLLRQQRVARLVPLASGALRPERDRCSLRARGEGVRPPGARQPGAARPGG